METIEQRITTLEAIEEIKQLKAHYALCADAKYTEDHQRKPQDEIDKIAWDQCSVFTEDALWDNGLFGRFEGKKAIWEFLRATPWKFSVHMFMNPLITHLGTSRISRPRRKSPAITRVSPVSSSTRLMKRSGSAPGWSTSRPPPTAVTSSIVTAVIGAVGPEH